MVCNTLINRHSLRPALYKPHVTGVLDIQGVIIIREGWGIERDPVVHEIHSTVFIQCLAELNLDLSVCEVGCSHTTCVVKINDLCYIHTTDLITEITALCGQHEVCYDVSVDIRCRTCHWKSTVTRISAVIRQQHVCCL